MPVAPTTTSPTRSPGAIAPPAPPAGRTANARPIARVACGIVAVQFGAIAISELGRRQGLTVGLAVAAAVAAYGAARWARLAHRAQALLSLVAGLLALGAGVALAIPHAVLTGPTGVDAVGIAGALAGVVMIVSGTRLALRGQRRALRIGIAVAGTFVVLQWWVWPLLGAGLATTAARGSTRPATALSLPGARDVTLPAADGTRLAGWYVPGRNGAAVILLHGSHGTRAGTLAHLRMLSAAGYAVLAIDARGHGRSGGQANALGWQAAADVGGAYAFLGRQAGIAPTRIAALGLSMGAEEALRAAADGVPLAAVVADGAGASTLGDRRLVAHGATAPVELSATWLMLRGTELLSGDREPVALTDAAADMRVPVLLIASRVAAERELDRILAARLGSRATLWVVNAGHTGGLAAAPDAYTARALAFLRSALATRS